MKNKMLFAFASLCLCLVIQSSRAQSIQYTVQVPDTLKPPPSQLYAFKLKAVGVQKYQCEGDKWVHKSPSAELFNEQFESREDAVFWAHVSIPIWYDYEGCI